ncbi:hypothetical protein MCHI_003046 [Candidatus Magnetoovum chiemensis]|nr:hypothetical protein MCHI_003046 [Candidatus Magnetoovum chiemensis]
MDRPNYNFNKNLIKISKFILKVLLLYAIIHTEMILNFERRYHNAIKEGKLTLTFRYWDTLRVLRGKIYRAQNLGLVRIVDVDFKKIKNITMDEIKRCGFNNYDDFHEDFSKNTEFDIDFDSDRAVRIEFEYIGEDIENYKKAMGNVKDSEIFNIKEQLLVLEQKNSTPWIKKTLKLLKENGGYIQSKELETELEIAPDRIKSYMRKLKSLHLISSNSRKGYCITPLGSKLLKHFSNIRQEEPQETFEPV